MKILKIIIECSEDMFSAYAENVEGIYGGGETVEEVKQSILDAIAISTEEFPPDNILSILKGRYDVVYHFDEESFSTTTKVSSLMPL